MNIKPLIALFVPLAAVLILVQPANACINDREVEVNEREFRSEYEVEPADLQVRKTQDESKSVRFNMKLAGIGGLGLFFLILGSSLLFFRRTNQN